MNQARNTFGEWWGESRYARAGELVKRGTPVGSVIFAKQHSGSLRFYGSRLTVRYDRLDRLWLDRSVESLMARGMHPYIVLEDWEQPEFKQRFQRVSALGSLDWSSVELFPGVRMWDAAPAWFVERTRSGKPENRKPRALDKPENQEPKAESRQP
jgi:hypothetical protein